MGGRSRIEGETARARPQSVLGRTAQFHQPRLRRRLLYPLSYGARLLAQWGTITKAGGCPRFERIGRCTSNGTRNGRLAASHPLDDVETVTVRVTEAEHGRDPCE